MFIQVLQGKVKDRELLGRQTDRWRAELKPGAKGYLGSTGGFSPDGQYIIMARMESAAAAKANSDRPEQTAWWNETEKAFDGDPTFHDCAEVDMLLGGGSNDAKFVQIVQGRAKNADDLRRMSGDMESQLRDARSDILGIVVAWHGDGGFTQAVYFSSEAEARKQEQAAENDNLRDQYMEMFDGAPTFIDLPSPELD
jgi:hypothetical protein